jgi:hypothetical protein
VPQARRALEVSPQQAAQPVSPEQGQAAEAVKELQES